MRPVLRVEFHCHTAFSKDCLLAPDALLECCSRKGIDRVVVTDHNRIDGARAAQRLDRERVIVGEEIMTTQGEVLAFYVQEHVPAGLTPRETISRLRTQDAFVSIAHPFDANRKGSWKETDLLAILPHIDAVEAYNSRCMWMGQNRRAADFARVHGLAVTVGSDAHTCWEVGRSTLRLPQFSSAAELRSVIRQGLPQTRWSPPWIHLSSRYAVLRKQLRSRLDIALRA